MPIVDRGERGIVGGIIDEGADKARWTRAVVVLLGGDAGLEVEVLVVNGPGRNIVKAVAAEIVAANAGTAGTRARAKARDVGSETIARVQNAATVRAKAEAGVVSDVTILQHDAPGRAGNFHPRRVAANFAVAHRQTARAEDAVIGGEDGVRQAGDLADGVAGQSQRRRRAIPSRATQIVAANHHG